MTIRAVAPAAAAVLGAGMVAGLATVAVAAAAPAPGPLPAPSGPPATTRLGVSAPLPPAPFQYRITCSNGQSFTGNLQGVGDISYASLPVGTTCQASPTAVPGLSDSAGQAFAPVPPAGVSTIHYAERLPALVLSPPVGQPGRATTVLGSGFAPNDTVTLAWSDGSASPALVQTDANGAFQGSVLVLRGAAVGVVSLVATGSGPSLLSTSADYLIEPNSVEAESSSAQVAFRAG